LRELIEEWDTANVVKLIEDVVHDKRFLEKDNTIREPFKTFLQLKLFGDKPVRTLLLLHHIQKGEDISRPDLARFLGDKFDDGTPYQDIKALLDCLEKLDILKGDEVTRRRKKTRVYRINDLDLHLSQKNLGDTLSGEEFAWCSIDFVDKKYIGKCKIKDFDGTETSFRPVSMFEELIRYGTPAATSCAITSMVLKEIAEEHIKDKQTVNKFVSQELQKKHANVAERFLSANPLGLKLKGEKYHDKFLTDDILNEILQDYLRRNKIRCLPAKPYKEIKLATLNQCMKGIRTKHEMDESEFPEILQLAVFRVYGKPLEEIISDPQTQLKKSKWKLKDAIENADSAEPTQTNKHLTGSLSLFLTYFLPQIGLLPAKEDIATVSLLRDFLTSSQTANVEPQTEEKETRKKLIDSLESKGVDVDGLQKCASLLLSIERESTSGVTLQDPLILNDSLKQASDFLKRLVEAFKQN
jgi:hypothetical protein